MNISSTLWILYYNFKVERNRYSSPTAKPYGTPLLWAFDRRTFVVFRVYDCLKYLTDLQPDLMFYIGTYWKFLLVQKLARGISVFHEVITNMYFQEHQIKCAFRTVRIIYVS